MVPIGKDYFYYEGKIYKEIKPNGSRWKLTTKQGTRKWITLKEILAFI